MVEHLKNGSTALVTRPARIFTIENFHHSHDPETNQNTYTREEHRLRLMSISFLKRYKRCSLYSRPFIKSINCLYNVRTITARGRSTIPRAQQIHQFVESNEQFCPVEHSQDAAVAALIAVVWMWSCSSSCS